MEVKEAIEFLVKEFIEGNLDPRKRKGLEEIISVLQRGEKFEWMWRELEYELDWHKPEEPLYTAKLQVTKDEEYLNEILDFMDDIKQKHFPKPARKTITIEFEAEKDNIITHHINILKADLERRKDCPTVKYNIKEMSQNET
jgi:predicted nucleotidyltransferase